jgi:hypothetical protein
MQWETFAFREEVVSLTKEGSMGQAVRNWSQLAGYGARRSWEKSRPTGSIPRETLNNAGGGAMAGALAGALTSGKGQRGRGAVEGAGVGALSGAITAPATTMLYRAHPHWSTHAAHLLAPDLVSGAVGAAAGLRRKSKMQKMLDEYQDTEGPGSPVKEAALGPTGKKNVRTAKRVLREAGGISAGMFGGYALGTGAGQLIKNTKMYSNLPGENKLRALQLGGALIGGAGMGSASLAKRIARAQDRRESRLAREAQTVQPSE